jgi:hypothetical protein
MRDYRSRDSYLPHVAKTLHKIFIRMGKKERGFEEWLPKQWTPFFDAIDSRFSDMLLNISLVTQVFKRPIRLPTTVFHGLEREMEWSPKKASKEISKEKDKGKDAQ